MQTPTGTDIRSILDPLKVPKEVKAMAWDAWHGSRNDGEFRVKFDKIPLPKEAKASLWDAKAFTPEQMVKPRPETPPQPTEAEPQWKRILSAFMDTTGGDPGTVQQGVGWLPSAGEQPEVRDMTAAADPGGFVGMAGPQSIVGVVKSLPGIRNLVKGVVGHEAKKSFLNAGEKAAVQLAAKEGVAMDAAQATGNPTLEGIKASIERLPLVGSKFARNTARQQEDLMRVGNKIIGETAGATDKVTAGEKVAGAVTGAVEKFDALADDFYGIVRKVAKSNTQTVQTGQKASQILDASGKPVMSAVTETIEAPTNIRLAKKVLQPFYEKLTKTMPLAQRQSSPGLQAIDQIINGPDVVALDTALSNLSAVKSLLRDTSPAVRTSAQGIAAFAGKHLDDAISTVVKGLGPEAESALAAGRKMTVLKHQAAELMDLSDEPVKLIQKLTAKGDTSIKTLESVAKFAPESIGDIGRATLEGIWQEATTTGRVQGKSLFNAWHRLGEETKSLLFRDAGYRKKLDDFFTLGAMLSRDANPSGSAKVGSIIAALGMVIRDPISGTAYILGGREAARLMTNPKGLELAKQALKTPLGQSGQLAREILRLAGVEARAGQLQPRHSTQK